MQTMITMSSEIHHLFLPHHTCNKVVSKKTKQTGEMVQSLKVFAALLEDLNLVPSTHSYHNHP